MGNPMQNEIDTDEESPREHARRFILEAIDEGRSAEDILDEVTTFFDGDICDLF